MSRIDDLLMMQEEQLLQLEAEEVAEFLSVFTDARQDLRDRLEALESRGLGSEWTAQHTRVSLAEMEDGVRVLNNRLSETLGRQVIRRRDMALEHLISTIRTMEPHFPGTGGAINTGALRRLSDSGELLLHKYSTTRYSSELMERIQAELARGHAAKLSRDEVIKRIVGADKSVFAGMEHRAALIDRMENARAYDAAFREGLLEANALDEEDEFDDDDPLLKKAVEFIDKRNHPFSRAVDGKLAKADGEWEVPVSEVAAAARAMKKGVSGILWRLDGNMYRGGSYPAHFNDRGRGVPWRVSWGT